MPLEILHLMLVFLGRGPAFERAQVSSSTRAGVFLSRVKPILAGRKFADHGMVLLCYPLLAIGAP
jgi:hypothetical protein